MSDRLTNFRRNEDSLRAYDSLKPLCKRIRRTMLGWFLVLLWTYSITIVLLYYSKEHAGITAWVLIAHVLITIFLWSKNNKRNGRLFSTLKEYVDVQQVDLLAAPYRSLKNFTCLLMVLDATFILWIVLFPIKIFFWIFYRVFRFRMRRVKRSILEGSLVLVPREDQIAQDPFYHFLLREGLYEPSPIFDTEEEGEVPFEEEVPVEETTEESEDGKREK